MINSCTLHSKILLLSLLVVTVEYAKPLQISSQVKRIGNSDKVSMLSSSEMISHNVHQVNDHTIGILSIARGKYIYYVADSSVYMIVDGVRTRLYTSSKKIMAIHATENALILSNEANEVLCIDLKTHAIHKLTLPEIVMKFVQDEDKLVCLCANGSITCIFLGDETLKDSNFHILWNLQTNMPVYGYTLNAIIDDHVLYCFHASDMLSIVDVNSGAIYKQIFFPYKKFAYVYMYTNKDAGVKKLYCISDNAFATIEYANYDWKTFSIKHGNYLIAKAYENQLFVATD